MYLNLAWIWFLFGLTDDVKFVYLHLTVDYKLTTCNTVKILNVKYIKVIYDNNNIIL